MTHSSLLSYNSKIDSFGSGTLVWVGCQHGTECSTFQYLILCCQRHSFSQEHALLNELSLFSVPNLLEPCRMQVSEWYAFLLQRWRTEKKRQETAEGFSGINFSKAEDLGTYLLKTVHADVLSALPTPRNPWDSLKHILIVVWRPLV